MLHTVSAVSMRVRRTLTLFMLLKALAVLGWIEDRLASLVGRPVPLVDAVSRVADRVYMTIIEIEESESWRR